MSANIVFCCKDCYSEVVNNTLAYGFWDSELPKGKCEVCKANKIEYGVFYLDEDNTGYEQRACGDENPRENISTND